MNIAVVQGIVRAEPDCREARDGSLVVSFDLVIGGVPRTQVPITWMGDAASKPAAIAEGQTLTVIGSVHRRFYRSGGTTSSRTDVRAERIVRGSGKRAEAAVAAAFDAAGESGR